MTESELIDIETINSLKAVLEEGIFELFTEFITDGPGAIERIATAVDKMDMTEIGKAAHYLKGSAGNIGAIALSNACMKLENQARNNDIENAAHHLDEIRNIYTETIHYMERQGS